MHAVYNSKHCTMRLYGDIKSRYLAAMENVITFTRFWYLIKRTTNSAAIRANWINCVLYKVLLNWHILPVLNIYTVPSRILVRYKDVMYIYTDRVMAPDTDKKHRSILECKIHERVLLNGAISICRRFSKVSHRFEAKMCGLSLLAIFTFWLFTLWHITLILHSKRKSSITAPAPLTTKRNSKQARLNANKSVFICLFLLLLFLAKPFSSFLVELACAKRYSKNTVDFFCRWDLVCRPRVPSDDRGN